LSLQKSLGFGKSGLKLAQILESIDIKNKMNGEISHIFSRLQNQKIAFVRKDAGGAAPITYGYEATILIDIKNT